MYWADRARGVDRIVEANYDGSDAVLIADFGLDSRTRTRDSDKEGYYPMTFDEKGINIVYNISNKKQFYFTFIILISKK